MSVSHYAYGFVAGLRDSCVGLLQLRALNSKIEAFREGKHASYIAAKATKDKLSLIDTIKRTWCMNAAMLGASVLTFYLLLLPLLELIASKIEGRWLTNVALPLTVWLFNAMWVLPIVVVLEVINYFSFKDIGQLVCIVSRRERHGSGSMRFSELLAHQGFGLLVQILFMLQAILVRLLPVPLLAEALYLCHIALLYSLQTFDYRWGSQGGPFQRRSQLLEEYWPFFLAFGLPMALVTWLPPWRGLSICCLSFVFPIYIVSALCSQRYHSYRAPIRLPLMQPSLFVAEKIMVLVTIVASRLPQAAGGASERRNR